MLEPTCQTCKHWHELYRRFTDPEVFVPMHIGHCRNPKSHRCSYIIRADRHCSYYEREDENAQNS